MLEDLSAERTGFMARCVLLDQHGVEADVVGLTLTADFPGEPPTPTRFIVVGSRVHFEAHYLSGTTQERRTP